MWWKTRVSVRNLEVALDEKAAGSWSRPRRIVVPSRLPIHPIQIVAVVLPILGYPENGSHVSNREISRPELAGEGVNVAPDSRNNSIEIDVGRRQPVQRYDVVPERDRI